MCRKVKYAFPVIFILFRTPTCETFPPAHFCMRNFLPFLRWILKCVIIISWAVSGNFFSRLRSNDCGVAAFHQIVPMMCWIIFLCQKRSLLFIFVGGVYYTRETLWHAKQEFLLQTLASATIAFRGLNFNFSFLARIIIICWQLCTWSMAY